MTSTRDVDSSLWHINGRRYDFSDFVNHHPGGREAINLGLGRDCTAMVNSYHIFRGGAEGLGNILNRYSVDFTEKERKGGDGEEKKCIEAIDFDEGKVRGSENSPERHDKVGEGFYSTLASRVRAHLLLHHSLDPLTSSSRCATPGRMLYQFSLAVATLLLLYKHATSPNCFASFALGVSSWLLGSLGHDAGHFAFSPSPAINKIALFGISFICNSQMWQSQHTFAHHSFTNSFEDDPDLHHFDSFIRVHRKFRGSGYKNQKYWPFVVLVYTLVVFGSAVAIPLQMLQTNSINGITAMTSYSSPLCFLECLVFVWVIILSPLVMSTIISALPCVLVNLSTTGLLFGLFSQINHLNHTSVLSPSARGLHIMPKDQWARTQVLTSNNFSPQSTAWHILSNGLNLQIEHHLFPHLNHCHLRKIQPVVRQVCEEWGVEYKCYEGYREAFRGLLAYLDALADVDVDGDKEE